MNESKLSINPRVVERAIGSALAPDAARSQREAVAREAIVAPVLDEVRDRIVVGISTGQKLEPVGVNVSDHSGLVNALSRRLQEKGLEGNEAAVLAAAEVINQLDPFTLAVKWVNPDSSERPGHLRQSLAREIPVGAKVLEADGVVAQGEEIMFGGDNKCRASVFEEAVARGNFVVVDKIFNTDERGKPLLPDAIVWFDQGGERKYVYLRGDRNEDNSSLVAASGPEAGQAAEPSLAVAAKNFLIKSLDTISEIENRIISPEKEYLAGAAIIGFSIIVLASPEMLPERFTNIIYFLREFSRESQSVFPDPIAITAWVEGALGGALTVDGARRIVRERLPLAKAVVAF